MITHLARKESQITGIFGTTKEKDLEWSDIMGAPGCPSDQRQKGLG